ncbi:hypothetical protein SAMN06893096_11318 [Geodermatophilus pulveris]|uniref:Uncharacterized protein n=1 Tax=Geodermatophilus pulveris TaxID=1564159 RepID=A0A239J6D1_9ACTN|nr:hypothetical protein SAMN06893096_11318 [Geodermatophilus pulveris]
MGWVWTAVGVWVLLAVPIAVLLGRVIRRADHQEHEASTDGPVPRPVPRRPARGPGPHR